MESFPINGAWKRGVTPLQHPEHYVRFPTQAIDFAAMRGFKVVGLSHMLNTERDLRLIRQLRIPRIPKPTTSC